MILPCLDWASSRGFEGVISIHFNKKNLLTKTVYLRTISQNNPLIMAEQNDISINQWLDKLLAKGVYGFAKDIAAGNSELLYYCC